jgi:hypothetical protein
LLSHRYGQFVNIPMVGGSARTEVWYPMYL